MSIRVLIGNGNVGAGFSVLLLTLVMSFGT